jgi:hypothetical protein
MPGAEFESSRCRRSRTNWKRVSLIIRELMTAVSVNWKVCCVDEES